MKKTDLGGAWQLRRTDWADSIEAAVPGTICTDLMRAGLLPDPYYKCNSDLFEEAAEYDYIYSREFEIDASDMGFRNITLVFEGLDTLCTVSVNGMTVAETDNMHRTWRFDLKPFVREGNNEISVLIKSPTKFCREKYAEKPLLQVAVDQCREGYPYLRKSHCMFGWDWGPVIPDGGIWKDIFLSFDNGLRLDSVFVTQEHTDDGRVFLTASAETEHSADDLRFELKFDGKAYSSDGMDIRFEVENPQLWYPAGFGSQPLYNLEFTAFSGNESASYSCRFGLRKAEVVTENDRFGTSMFFRVNGIPIFSKGANYIPEDSILTRCSRERTKELLSQAIECHNNTVRIWGGATYAHDYFYDLCDEMGILVWQDLMFACSQYPNDEKFYDSIAHETEDNMKRLRNHASLIMWSGNNECELAMIEWWHQSGKALEDYQYQYNTLLRGIAKKLDPTRYYMPSSPTGTGDFRNINTEEIGDSHYWEIWGQMKPLDEYLKYHFRFISEFGFQSLPCLETVETFTEADDRNLFTRVMEHHQRNGSANEKILLYSSKYFRFPKSFDSLIYISQVVQAEAIRIGVEHSRRNRCENRCMGTIYWQLNDCWPVASWAGIDYLGRWKALQYSSKKFYAPVLLSAVMPEKNRLLVSLTNDTVGDVTRSVYYAVKDRRGSVLAKNETAAVSEALSSADIFDETLSEIDPYTQYIEFGMDGEAVGTLLLCPDKHFEYENPEIEYSLSVRSGKTVVTLTCKSLARFVELKADGGDAKFSDNFFSLSAGDKKEIVCDRCVDSVKIRSVFDSY